MAKNDYWQDMMLDDPIYCKAEFYKDSRTHVAWIHKLYSAIKINS